MVFFFKAFVAKNHDIQLFYALGAISTPLILPQTCQVILVFQIKILQKPANLENLAILKFTLNG